MNSTGSNIYLFGGFDEDYHFCETDVFNLYETNSQSEKNWRIIDDLDAKNELMKKLNRAELTIED